MKARAQRTHYMGYSNRNSSMTNKNQTTDILQKSFNKTRSHYYHTNSKITSFIGLTSNITKPIENNNKSYSSQMNINTVYKDAEKGHHHEFQNKKFRNQKNIQKLYDDIVHRAPLPLNHSSKLNSQLAQIKNDYKDKEINLHKLFELKKTFLRNNQKKGNLKDYFNNFANHSTGVIDKEGFKKLIKQYGYDINESEVELVFRLNNVHNETVKKGNQSQSLKNQIDLGGFVNLMTKENVYFKTLKIHDTQIPTHTSYRFSPPQFQIFRNSFPKLKEALKIYNNQPITQDKFQQIMKKLNITDLILKQHQRNQIFTKLSNQNGQLNSQKLLGLIATQQHQRISQQRQMKVTNYDNFQQNLSVHQEFLFQKNNKHDPLLQLLYPVNLKRTSFVDYERTVKQAKEICDKIKQIKNQTQRDLIKELCLSTKGVKKQQLFNRVQTLLQQQGYNFTKNQYKSFLSHIDFDSNDKISNQKLQNIILNETQKQRVNRLDRRVRNQSSNVKQQQLQQDVELNKNPQDQFVDKIRAKSSVNWNSVRKTFIKQNNIAEFKVPTKFSAWPDRLYQTDLSLVQPHSSFGMGISENNRFHKQQKHSLGQQDRMKRLRNYENKVRKVAERQQMNQQKLQERSFLQEKKQQSKHYNLRLLKEQYEDRCHSRSLVQ